MLAPIGNRCGTQNALQILLVADDNSISQLFISAQLAISISIHKNRLQCCEAEEDAGAEGT